MSNDDTVRNWEQQHPELVAQYGIVGVHVNPADVTFDQFKRMGYRERVALYEADRQVYERFADAENDEAQRNMGTA